jgi:DNA-directed RNA polymerase III subunit RPC4
MQTQVTSATQPSFLSHAVHVDTARKRLCVLGEVNKRFIVTPDVEMLLADLDVADKQTGELGVPNTGLLRMDES